jgi:signal peptidase II
VSRLALRLLSPAVILGVFALDRWSKALVLTRVYFGESIPVLPFFHITHLQNTGVAFGMGQERNALFILTSAALLVVLLVMRRRWEREQPENLGLKIGLALVIGGALGNLYDRIAYGSVVDFLLFFVGEYHWPAFNAADSAICTGAGLLLWSQWRGQKTAEARK